MLAVAREARVEVLAGVEATVANDPDERSRCRPAPGTTNAISASVPVWISTPASYIRFSAWNEIACAPRTIP